MPTVPSSSVASDTSLPPLEFVPIDPSVGVCSADDFEVVSAPLFSTIGSPDLSTAPVRLITEIARVLASLDRRAIVAFVAAAVYLILRQLDGFHFRVEFGASKGK